MFSATNIILPALIFIVVGFLAGVLVMILVGDIRRRREEKTGTGAPMDDLIVPEMPSLPESRFESVANLYREKRSGKLLTDIKGKVHLNRGTLTPEQLSVLQESARSWLTWLGVQAPAEPVNPSLVKEPLAPVPAVKEGSSVLPEVEAKTEDAPASVIETAEAAEPQTPQELPDAETIVPVSMVEEVPLPKRTGPLEKPRTLSLVGQVNDILQEMLPESKFTGQNIQLTEEPVNGVVVWVGAQKYYGIDSVADPEIKAFIQSAVRQWEAETGRA